MSHLETVRNTSLATTPWVPAFAGMSGGGWRRLMRTARSRYTAERRDGLSPRSLSGHPTAVMPASGRASSNTQTGRRLLDPRLREDDTKGKVGDEIGYGNAASGGARPPQGRCRPTDRDLLRGQPRFFANRQSCAEPRVGDAVCRVAPRSSRNGQ